MNKIQGSLIKIVGSCFFIGHLPLIPGTFGSILGAALVYVLLNQSVLYAALLGALMVLGFSIGSAAERLYGSKDPRFVVIDEVCGMMISCALLPFINLKLLVLGFFIFRLMDTLKPFPADRLQARRGGAGIMLDDVVAGLYTNVILQIVARLALLTIS
ncbi:MAG: phosphatidylglycerophosphatase A [Candidatus Omnitrophica bacterium]|nr:phosphatidylglycerophosphatase A [Candidatus Omnitrophota bacterium]